MARSQVHSAHIASKQALYLRVLHRCCAQCRVLQALASVSVNKVVHQMTHTQAVHSFYAVNNRQNILKQQSL
eukprot:21231-Heterococcus_DN1.PRE.14